MLLALVAHLDLELEQMDVKTSGMVSWMRRSICVSQRVQKGSEKKEEVLVWT